MNTWVLAAVFFLLAPFTVHAAPSDIAISEAMFNPTGVDTGFEYIVLENKGTSPVDMTGWDLYPSGIGYFTFPTFTLGAGSRVTIYLRAVGTNDAVHFYHTAVAGKEIKENMGNTSGSVALFSSTSHTDSALVDFVEYGKAGQTWESSADKMKLWTKGEFISLTDFEEGQVLSRKDAGHGLSSWEIKNVSAGAPTPPPATESDPQKEQSASVTDSGSKVYSGPEIKPKIRAYAGRDRSSVSGAAVVFEGKALGWQDDILSGDQIRYVWNFGDGVLADGKKIPHIYEYPGVYTATFYVVSGEESEGDSVKITITENPVRLSEILPGTDGWVELTNPSAQDIDISGWQLRAGGQKTFVFPRETVLAARSFVVFPARVTALEFSGENADSFLFYPNGKIADELRVTGTISKGKSFGRLGVEKPTPGAAPQKSKEFPEKTSNIKVTATHPKIIPEKISTPTSSLTVKEKTNKSDVATTETALTAQLLGGEKSWLLISIITGIVAGGAVVATRLFFL